MNKETRRLYCELLAQKISEEFGIEISRARQGVEASAIQTLIDEDPIYVDHVPLSSWAEDVYEEMTRNKR